MRPTELYGVERALPWRLRRWSHAAPPCDRNSLRVYSPSPCTGTGVLTSTIPLRPGQEGIVRWLLIHVNDPALLDADSFTTAQALGTPPPPSSPAAAAKR
jgi:hypothetical protein